MSNVWFNRKGGLYSGAPELKDSVKAIYPRIDKLIKSEIALGIPENRIVVGKWLFCCKKMVLNASIFLYRWVFNGRCISPTCCL